MYSPADLAKYKSIKFVNTGFISNTANADGFFTYSATAGTDTTEIKDFKLVWDQDGSKGEVVFDETNFEARSFKAATAFETELNKLMKIAFAFLEA